jgi:hypothetical protein
MRRLTCLLLPLAIAACGPKLSAEAIAGHTVMITNDEDHAVTVQRIVANDDEGKAECVEAPAAALGPGRTYTTTFFYCDAVTKVRVETDAGTARLTVGS